MTIENPQSFSIKGMIRLSQFEAIVLVPYPDGWKDKANGIRKYSIAMGSQTPEVNADDPPITLEQAVERTWEEVRKREDVLNRFLKVEVTQNQFDALLIGYYQRGTSLLRGVGWHYNEGQPIEAALAYADFASGEDFKVTLGHAKRRGYEMLMALDDFYGDLDKIAFYDSSPHLRQKKWKSSDEVFPGWREGNLSHVVLDTTGAPPRSLVQRMET